MKIKYFFVVSHIIYKIKKMNILKKYLPILLIYYSTCKETKGLEYLENKINDKEINIIENQKYFLANSTDICTNNNCPPFQGICFENTCHCNHGFETLIENTNEPVIYCNYKLKSRFVAFFLELFFPFGAGHLYAENTLLAMIKFVSFSMILFTCCGVLFSIALEDKNCGVKCFGMLFLLMIVFWGIFETIDLVCYGLGIYKDGKGFTLI
jgi:hypothetical protein